MLATWLLLALFVPVFGLCMGVRGPIYGTIYSTNALGAAVGSLVGGALHDLSGGYAAAYVFSLLCLAVAAVPFLRVPALRDFR